MVRIPIEVRCIGYLPRFIGPCWWTTHPDKSGEVADTSDLYKEIADLDREISLSAQRHLPSWAFPG